MTILVTLMFLQIPTRFIKNIHSFLKFLSSKAIYYGHLTNHADVKKEITV